MKIYGKKILESCSCWADFEKKISGLDSKAKGDCFELLTYYALLLNPEYSTKMKNVWMVRDLPPRIRTKLSLPKPDEGIDIVAQTKDGDFWAIQCKYRDDPSKSITRAELSTFTDLAFVVSSGFSHGLVCTTSDKRSRKSDLYRDKIAFCLGDYWRNLSEEFFALLRRALAGKKTAIIPFKPRLHQVRAIDNAREHFRNNSARRGKLILPCGTGKSLSAFWIAEELGAKTILVAVPSLALIRQTLLVWSRESVANNRKINWICVCSDKTVGNAPASETALSAQDLGVKIHTDPDEIASWLRKRRQGLTVVMSTYQSGRAISEAARKAKRTFDLGIMDEAHRMVGMKDSLFSHLLYDEHIKIRNRLFMTATERRYVGKSDRIASMEDPDLFGDTFELLSFKSAMECDPPILSDYQIVTIAVRRDDFEALIDQNLYVRPDKGTWNDDVEAEMLASVVALRKAMNKKPIRHAVSFHTSIARAKAFKASQDALTNAMPEYKKLDTFHVSGNMASSQREKEMENFEASKRSLITNARCLTEGVDVPEIDCVLFADPRKSTIDIVQAVGRAMRPAKGKKRGYVVVPVLMDSEIDGNDADLSTAFDSILSILRALASNDERILDELRSVSKGRKLRKSQRLIDIDLPVGINIDTDAFVEAIETRFWSKLSKLSWMPFGEAREYVRGLGINSRSEWKAFRLVEGNLPSDIPANPAETYKDRGWVSWGDWLGTGTIAPQYREFRSFQQARKFARSLGFHGRKEWTAFCRVEGNLPEDIPSAPGGVYKDQGWNGWGDWLGTDFVATYDREYRSFRQARSFARSLGLRSRKEWGDFCKVEGNLPLDIPSGPARVYKNKGWNGWGDWLGTGTIAPHQRKFLSFEQARKFAHNLGLTSSAEWRKFCTVEGNLPLDIPSDPARVYKNRGWIGWGDWLGTGTVATRGRKFWPFEKARAFARSLGLKGAEEWTEFCKIKGNLPEYIPSSPWKIYKDEGWRGRGDWLGTGVIANQHLHFSPYKQAREFASGLGLKSRKEWTEFCKVDGNLPSDIPANPPQTYRGKGWVSWGDWLGTGTTATHQRKFRSFRKARDFARALGLKTKTEWETYRKIKGNLPADIPSNPWRTYKNDGWISWPDWLGTDLDAENSKR